MEVNDEEKFVGDEFERYYQQLLRHSQLKKMRGFLVGSVAELIIIDDTENLKQFGLSDNDQDLDYMRYSTSEYVFSHERQVPKRYSGIVLRIDSCAMHPGYTKLIRELDKNRTCSTARE